MHCQLPQNQHLKHTQTEENAAVRHREMRELALALELALVSLTAASLLCSLPPIHSRALLTSNSTYSAVYVPSARASWPGEGGEGEG